MLTLYRRHTQSCQHQYPQNKRILRPTTKAKTAKDCECPIQAEGVLKIARRITNRSTRTNVWDEAEARARQWETWGQTESPVVVVKNIDVTVKYAADSFLQSKGPKGENKEASTIKAFEVLLQKRLVPYAEIHQLAVMRAFDDLDVLSKFVEFWRS